MSANEIVKKCCCLFYELGLNIGIYTVFPLISAPGAYQILKLLGAALIKGWR